MIENRLSAAIVDATKRKFFITFSHHPATNSLMIAIGKPGEPFVELQRSISMRVLTPDAQFDILGSELVAMMRTIGAYEQDLR